MIEFGLDRTPVLACTNFPFADLRRGVIKRQEVAEEVVAWWCSKEGGEEVGWCALGCGEERTREREWEEGREMAGAGGGAVGGGDGRSRGVMGGGVALSSEQRRDRERAERRVRERENDRAPG